jgi:hypothetical protein
MRLARYGDGAYYVPGGELLWLELDGETIGVRSREIYQDVDGSIVPGVLESPIRTELRLIQYPANEPHRYQPLVCHACGDSGDSQRKTWDPCEACGGYGETKNLHLCAHCGEFSLEVLPLAPREVCTHPLLLEHMHPACAIEMVLDELVGRGAVS